MNVSFFFGKMGIINPSWKVVKQIRGEQWKELSKWCPLLLGLVKKVGGGLCKVGKEGPVLAL